MTHRPVPPTLRLTPLVLMCVLLALWLAACAGDSRTSVPDMSGTGVHPQPDAMGASWPTSEVDYLGTMVEHHREAIAAAGELVRSPDASMRALGRSIVTSQSRQVALMRGWLGRWYPTSGAPTYIPMMRELQGVTGDDLDRAFLEDMVVHHMAAVMMSRHALITGLLRHAPAAALARRIISVQAREIGIMRQWLRDRFGLSGPIGHVGTVSPMGPWMMGSVPKP